ncbi:MAG: DoxX family membrane protein [Desulfobacterales bacterium]|nr:DoxX family membrane protein [Desulfobacterales bacterium]
MDEEIIIKGRARRVGRVTAPRRFAGGFHRVKDRVKALFPSWLYLLVRLVFAAVFFWSGVTKLLDPVSFAVVMDAFGLIPESWVMPAAVALPALEAAAAVGLLLDVRGSLTLMAGMLALFMAILSYGLWLGLDVDCGCFGPDDPEGEAFHGLRSALYRDLVMMAGIFYLYMCRVSRAARPVRPRRLA